MACLWLWMMISCAHLAPSLSQERVEHVVICWLKTPGDLVQRKKLIEVSKCFEQIPGVLKVKAGSVLPSERQEVDSSFDVAVIISFENEKALRDYQTHPIHQKAVHETLIPLVQKFLVYDFKQS